MKLGEELQYEMDAAEESEPEFLAAFKAQGVWDLRLSIHLTSRSSKKRRMLIVFGWGNVDQGRCWAGRGLARADVRV